MATGCGGKEEEEEEQEVVRERRKGVRALPPYLACFERASTLRGTALLLKVGFGLSRALSLSLES